MLFRAGGAELDHVHFYFRIISVGCAPERGGESRTKPIPTMTLHVQSHLLVPEVENMMVAAERVLEYTQLPQEAAWIVGPKQRDGNTQIPRGRLSFTNLQLRYREGLGLALKGVTCEVKPREKVGIVVGYLVATATRS